MNSAKWRYQLRKIFVLQGDMKRVRSCKRSLKVIFKRGFFWIFWDYLDDLFKWSCRAMSRESTKAESKTKGFIFDTWSPSLWRSKSRGVYNGNLILWKLSLDPAKTCANALVVDRCDNELKHKNLVNILRMFCSLTVICSKSVSSPSLAEALIRLCWNESSNIISYVMTVFFSCWALCERNVPLLMSSMLPKSICDADIFTISLWLEFSDS